MSTLKQRLQERGWFLKPEVLAEVSNKQGESSETHVMHSELLNVDLRKRGIGMLPENILTQKVGHIQGPLIVQASEVVDVSRPSYNASNSGDGVLFCTLNDGRIKGSAVALEAASCPLSTQTAPGTKLLIVDAEIEHGLIILDTACIQVLGGRVDNLADAWEAQQKYSSVKRMNKVEINSMGPVFSPFDPTKKKQLVKGQFSMAFPAAVSSSPSGTGTDTLRTSTANAEGTQSATETAWRSGSTLPATHPVKRDPPVGTEAAASLANAAKVKEKLQEKMSHDAAAYEARGGSRGSRGRGRGRRGRRRDDDPEDSGVMTMEQWEARQAGRAAPQGLHMDSDEQLARQLQAQLNAEAAEETRAQQPRGRGANMADALFSDRHTDQGPGGRRDREGRRGGRGCGRGRARW